MMKRKRFLGALFCLTLALCAGLSSCGKSGKDHSEGVGGLPPAQVHVWGLVEAFDGEEPAVRITVKEMGVEYQFGRPDFSLFSVGDQIWLDCEAGHTLQPGQVVHLMFNYYNETLETLWPAYILSVWDDMDAYTADAETGYRPPSSP